MRSLLLVVFVLGLLPQEIASEKEYRERMEDIDHSFSALRRNRDLQRHDEIQKEAVELSGLFAKVETFWKGRGNEEAAGFAHMAKEGADTVNAAAKKHEQKALEAGIASIAASCEGCHKEPLDKYRFPRR
jgi:cytochrome c553